MISHSNLTRLAFYTVLINPDSRLLFIYRIDGNRPYYRLPPDNEPVA